MRKPVEGDRTKMDEGNQHVKCNKEYNVNENEPENSLSKTIFADEIKKSIFQKCHQLADLTGCSVFIKVSDPSDKESLYYGTYEYIRDYNEEGLKSEDKDVAVSGSTGLPITTADVCTEPPWNMFMWMVNDNNKLSMISNHNSMDVPEQSENGLDEFEEKLSDADSQKTESADEDDLVIDEKLDEYDDDEENDPDYQPEGKAKDLSKKKEDANLKKQEDKEDEAMTANNSETNASTSSVNATTTTSTATLSDREHQNLLSCLPKLDGFNAMAVAAVPFKSLAHQGDTSLLPFNMLLEQQMKNFKYAPFSEPGLALSTLANAGFHHLNNSGISSNSMLDNGLAGDQVERRFHCEVCGKGFSLLGNLKTHRRIHNQEKPFKCDTCGKGFTQSGNLRAHERIHTGEKPFCCHVCAKSFVQIQHLKSHMRTHSGERPYQCKHCGKAFTQASTLRAHIRIHSGERPYQCKICCKAFSQSSNLKEHYRVHTKQQLRQQEGLSLIGFPSNNGMENLSPLSNDNTDTAMDRSLTDLSKLTSETIF